MPATGPDFISLQARPRRIAGVLRAVPRPRPLAGRTSARRCVRNAANRVRAPRGRSGHRPRIRGSARHRCRDLGARHRRPEHPRCSRGRRPHHRLRTDRRPLRPDIHLRRPRRLPRHPPRPRLIDDRAITAMPNTARLHRRSRSVEGTKKAAAGSPHSSGGPFRTPIGRDRQAVVPGDAPYCRRGRGVRPQHGAIRGHGYPPPSIANPM